MLPFENMVADYVKETGNHVLYRVTPVYEGDELVARGVLMEAYSVEDNGEGICFCVYCYNVQPGIVINYKDGTSTLSGKEDSDNGSREAEGSSDQIEYNYVLNTNSKVFHYDTCSSASSIADHNKKTCTATREEMISDGYSPCGKCKP
jgi:DNA-entry nuclease